MDLNNLVNPFTINLVNGVFENLEELEEELEEAETYPLLKNFNPFETLADHQFQKIYRLNKFLVRELIETVSPFVKPPRNEFSLTIEHKVLLTLHFYANGSYQAVIGSNMFCMVSQSTVSRVIFEVSKALNNSTIFNKYVSFPSTKRELDVLKQSFYNKYGFPGIVGCIDCTHVSIVTPFENEHIYVNRKMYHSINVQLICDDNMRILNVNARFPGSVHDVRIWQNSNVSQTMQELQQHYPHTFHFLGDSGYPLRTWLLIPFQNPLPGTPEERFNNAQTSIRSTIERCNGVLKNRFRCLLKDRVLHYRPERASFIINACVILHNICIQENVTFLLNDDEENIVDRDQLGYVDVAGINDHNRRVINPDLEAGRLFRQAIVERFFY